MFCKKCGAEIKGNARFCVKCGTPIAGGTHNTAKSVQQQRDMGQISPQQKPVQRKSMASQQGAAQPKASAQQKAVQPKAPTQQRTVQQGVPVQDPSTLTPQNVGVPENGKSGGGGKAWLIVLIVVLALLIVGGGGVAAWFFLGGSFPGIGKATEQEAQEEETEEETEKKEDRKKKKKDTDDEEEQEEEDNDEEKAEEPVEKDPVEDENTSEKLPLEERLMGAWGDKGERRVEVSLDMSGEPVFKTFLYTASGWFQEGEFSRAACTYYQKDSDNRYTCVGNNITASFEMIEDDRMLFGYGDLSFIMYPSEEKNVTYTTVNPTSSKDFILPDSSTRQITAQEIQNLTKEELRIARNEIFARHGRMFEDQALALYFSQKSWYHGTIPAKQFSMDMLSQLEKDNIKVIEARENQLQ